MCSRNNRLCLNSFTSEQLNEMNGPLAKTMVEEVRYGVITDVIIINVMNANELITYLDQGF